MSDPGSMAGRVALVTGAAQGLGRGFSRAFLQRGAKVGIVDMNEEQGQKTTQEFSAEFGNDRVTFCKCDITNDQQMKDTFKKVKEKFGGLDVVVNNAGIGREFEGWELCVDINVKGTIRGTVLALDMMRKDKGGKGGVIINVSSMAGINPNPCGPVYNATKAAVLQFSLSYAVNPQIRENGVRINVLCPALAGTDLVYNLGPGNIHLPHVSKIIEEKVGVMTVEECARDMMELVEDETKHGAVLMVSKAGGKVYKQ